MSKRLIFLFTLVAFVMIASSQNPARRAPVAGGQSIAKWKIEDVVRSFSAKNDTVYVVNFWATFCKPCNEEIPDFIRIVEKYKSQKVKLLLVSLDLPSYVPVKLPAFIKKYKYNTNHVWLNETNADHFCPMIDPKWSGAIPSTIIVNNNTGYRKFVEDQMSAADFEKALKEAIGGSAMNKYVAPMNDAEVIEYKQTSLPSMCCAGMNMATTFQSCDNTVYSIMDGNVGRIIEIEGFKVVIIENDGVFYTYSNLASTFIKQDEHIKANQLVGYAALDLDGYKPSIDLYISNAEKNILLTKEDFGKRRDKKLTDNSIDFNEPQ